MKGDEIEQRRWKEGFTEGMARPVLDLLGSLDDVPSALRETILAQKEEETLHAWLRMAAKAKSIAEFTKQITM